jgi:hypothetical protein
MSAAKGGTSEWRGPAPQNVDISRKVAFLATPRVYAEQPTGVEIVETHFSWVFLTDRYVYKLKKPLRGDGFDFSTAQARRRNAEAEVSLNRRLAADIYLGAVPLTLAGGHRLAIGGKGVVVDWLVKMVRLSAKRMLDRRLACGDWHYTDTTRSPIASPGSSRRPGASRSSRWPISTASALNAARAAVLFIPAAVPRCDMPSTASCVTSRPLSAAVPVCCCNASRLAGS